MTAEQIAALRALCDAAAPGEWRVFARPIQAGRDWREIVSDTGRWIVRADSFTRTRDGESVEYSGVYMAEADARYMVAAVNAIPSLLAALDAVTGERAEWEQVARTNFADYQAANDTIDTLTREENNARALLGSIEANELLIAPQVGGGWAISVSRPAGDSEEVFRTRAGLVAALIGAVNVLKGPLTITVEDSDFAASTAGVMSNGIHGSAPESRHA
jgi:hypothetical protein